MLSELRRQGLVKSESRQCQSWIRKDRINLLVKRHWASGWANFPKVADTGNQNTAFGRNSCYFRPTFAEPVCGTIYIAVRQFRRLYQRHIISVVVLGALWRSISSYCLKCLTDLSNFPACVHSIPRISSRIFAVSASRSSMSAIISSGLRSGSASVVFGFLTDRS